MGTMALRAEVVERSRWIVLQVATLAGLALAPPLRAQEAEATLRPAVAHLDLHRGKRTASAESFEPKLAPSVRVALNEWMPLAAELGLQVQVGETAEAVILGSGSEKQLVEAAEWLDEAAELFEPLLGSGTARDRRAVVAFLLDEPALTGEAWPALLDAFAEKRLMDRSAVATFKDRPGGLTLRHAGLFVQPSWDMAGDAAAGDDEFRLGNELVHKYTQMVVRSRYGQVPETFRWGLGYVAEQRLFRSIYQFDASGFVASESHFGWPKKTRELVIDRARDKSFSLGPAASDAKTAGLASPSQMLTWGALDYLLAKDPEALSGLLVQLAALHDEADPRGRSREYAGDEEATAAVLAASLEAVDLRKLKSHLKKVK